MEFLTPPQYASYALKKLSIYIKQARKSKSTSNTFENAT
jgi:hypothetical protein